MSTYVVGDVQGCYRELELLLTQISFGSSDELWLLGDLINRGPDNTGVLNLALDNPNIHAILGNHDLHFLAVAMGQQTAKRMDTLQDLLSGARLEEYINYLRGLPLLYQITNIHSGPFKDVPLLLAHAGIPSIFSVSQALALAAEVEDCLQSTNCSSFLKAMYGNQPEVWNDALTGFDRLRVITNYFTRLRYCDQRGTMELNHKADLAPKGYARWFSFPRSDELSILFGHWAALNGKSDASFAVALDTGCVWGGSLTALRVEDNTLFSVPAIQDNQ